MNQQPKRSTTLLATAMATALAMPIGVSFANEANLHSELQMLRDRVTQLEAEQQQEPASIATGNWSDAVSVGGYVEVEAAYHSNDYEDSSDIIISDAELWAEAEIAENVSAMILFYYEDGYDAPDVDEATIAYSPNDALTFTAGRTYLPFGVFETNMISDPITLEVGETREDLLMVGADMDGIYGSAYVFNGDIEELGEDDAISNYGVNLGYYWEQDEASVDVGVDWINSIQDTDGLEWTYGEVFEIEAVDEKVSGLALHANARYGPFSLITEYVGAMKDLAGKGTNTQLKAWSLEAGYDFIFGGMDSTVALGYQETTEALYFDLPETRVLGAVSMEVMPNTMLAFEYKRDTDYFGEESDTGTAQVAVEF
jgi:hypothetical protein